MKNPTLRFPVFSQYAGSMLESLYDRGDGLYKSRRGVLFSNYAATINTNCTGGIFATSLLLILLQKATSEEYTHFIALYTAVLSFGGIAQILSPMLFERMKRRRAAIYTLSEIYHGVNVFLLPAITMLQVPTAVKANLFMAACGIMTACSALSSPACGVWMMHSLPQECRSDFLMFQNPPQRFSRRRLRSRFRCSWTFFRKRTRRLQAS